MYCKKEKHSYSINSDFSVAQFKCLWKSNLEMHSSRLLHCSKKIIITIQSTNKYNEKLQRQFQIFTPFLLDYIIALSIVHDSCLSNASITFFDCSMQNSQFLWNVAL